MTTSTRLRASATIAALALSLAAWRAPIARAEGDGASPSEPSLQELMEKVVQMMRSSERALLEASRSGGSKPTSVDVPRPPATDGGAAPPSGAPPPATKEGEAAKKGLDEILSGARTTGGRIPRELEDILSRIPH